MADKFHINPENGNPSRCRALFRCPFGGADEHYPSQEKARAAYEKQMVDEQNQRIRDSLSPAQKAANARRDEEILSYEAAQRRLMRAKNRL